MVRLTLPQKNWNESLAEDDHIFLIGSSQFAGASQYTAPKSYFSLGHPNLDSVHPMPGKNEKISKNNEKKIQHKRSIQVHYL